MTRPPKNNSIYTVSHLLATNSEGFTKRVGNICVNTQTGEEFCLFDTSIDLSTLPRPEGLSTVKLKMIKRGETHE